MLEDGTRFDGAGFGAPAVTTGEVVFTTGMVGYPEALTDPSYRGQILTFTYPILGNYGVPSLRARDAWGLPAGFESGEMQVRAMLVRSLADPHHWNSRLSLPEWLRRSGIPGIQGLDTRRLTEHLRSSGVMRGIVAVGRTIPSPESLLARLGKAPRYEEEDFLAQVSPRRATWVASRAPRAPTVAVIDCGCKTSILRSLLRRGLDVLRLPPGEPLPEKFDGHRIRGLVVGNGPGDPATLAPVVETLSASAARDLPTLGICLGHQLLALSRGGRTFKLKYGHRGQNKPVVFLDGRAYILSENHGYAVDPATLSASGFSPWAQNPDDGTLEAFRDARGRVIGIQGHPEGGPGPREASFVFDLFAEKVRRSR